jgi:hypothetical protein
MIRHSKEAGILSLADCRMNHVQKKYQAQQLYVNA